MKQRDISTYIDFAFCVLLLPALMLLLPLDRWLEHRPLFVVLLVVWLYGVYILQRRYIVKLLFVGQNRNRLFAFIIFIITIVITYLLTKIDSEPLRPEVVDNHLSDFIHYRMRTGANMRLQQQAIWFLYVIVSAFSAAVALLTQLNRQIMLSQSIEFEKKRAELALYKAQINPHFLFNTLNTLYGLVVTQSERAEEAFVLFTNLMKYIYTNGSANLIALEAEVEYIEQYIELQRMRLNEQTVIDFRYEGVDSRLLIAPMLLITFVENAFKHGVSAHKASRIEIHLRVEDDTLYLTTRNPIFNPAQSDSGIGVENCQKRLDLLYPKGHTLSIDQSEEVYSLELTIMLQNSKIESV